MPCACGGNRTANKGYKLIVPGKPPKTFTSEVEARTAAARIPGATVKPA